MEITPGRGVVIGSLLGLLNFYLFEKYVPRESSCVYLAPWQTDLLAWAGGAWLIERGYAYDDGIISLLGAGIVCVHITQVAAHKVLLNRKLGKLPNTP